MAYQEMTIHIHPSGFMVRQNVTLWLDPLLGTRVVVTDTEIHTDTGTGTDAVDLEW